MALCGRLTGLSRPEVRLGALRRPGSGPGRGLRRIPVPGRGLPGAGTGGSGQDPGTVTAGQPVPQQGAQVDRGAPVVQPGAVLGCAGVAELDAVPVLSRGPGDDPLDHRPGGVGTLELRRAGLGTGFAEQLLVRVDRHRAAVFSGGALLPQRAAGAGGAEGDDPVLAHLADLPGRAGDGAGLLVDGEVIEGEPAGHGRLQRFRLDDSVVPVLAVGGPGLTAAVGRVTVNLKAIPPGLALRFRLRPGLCL